MNSVGALLQEQVRRFANRHLNALHADRAGEIPQSVRDSLRELGVFGVTLPEAYGGAGLGLGDAAGVVAELARVDRSVAVMVGLHLGLGTRALVEHGRPELQRQWLPRLADGAAIASFAATESGAGSDLSRLGTKAELRDGSLILRGEKAYVTNGGFASCFTVLAQTPGFGGARAHSLLFVPRDTPGVSIGAEEVKLGIRASSTVPVQFDDVRVPVEHVLGAPGQGLTVAHRALEWGRCIMSAGCLGTAERALHETVRHVTTRRQFGKPLLEQPLVREHLARMEALRFAMGVLITSVAERDAAGQDVGLYSAIAKVFASEAVCEITDLAVQLHGASGVMEDVGVAILSRDCRVTRIFEGANDVLLQRIGIARVGSDAETLTRLGLDLDPHVLAQIPGAGAQAQRLADMLVALRERDRVQIMRRGRHLGHIARATTALLTACLLRSRGTRGDRVPACAEVAMTALVGDADRALSSLEHDDNDAALDDRTVSELIRGSTEHGECPVPNRPAAQEYVA